MSIPVLTYHSNNVHDATYSGNDHVALAHDLELLAGMGVRIISLHTLFAWHQGGSPESGNFPGVVITFDDGSDFDFHDLPHPTLGVQQAFYNILWRHQETTATAVHASSFVITSPEARSQLDERGLIGKGWWQDDWWHVAQSSGVLSIECHSWDHVHPVLDRVAQSDNVKGDFSAVASYEDCRRQVQAAGDYIQSRLHGRRPDFYAYPWGQYSAYMVERYLPDYQHEHGFLAAFTVDPEPVSRAHSRWLLPRFVCGRDWSSGRDLERLLASCW